ncbi:ABC transporter permease [Bacillus sp. B15-48]|uniref:ABC transporter permease n=1 Tax=Bacillus sp. B15-48 TaxID=1548601 RepID=UPI00193F37B1|nr:ABC transporter permease [Bacillus sp. B15-48]MBM4761848.1 ABC transporter permease [Bacillus sp. B15-48]
MDKTLLSKTARLSYFILRLDRIRIPLWLFGLTFFTIIVPIAFDELYGSDSAGETAGLAETMANPAMTAMVGPGNLDDYTIGAMTAHQMLLMTAVIVGLMAILLVARHTRADEEDGRLEMIRSFPVGRLSYLNATLLVITGTSVLLALINGFGLYALGIESMNLEGSMLYGASLGATLLFFAGITAIFAQLSQSSRGTIGLSISFLLLAYLVRGMTDVSNEALSWISPLGWVTKAEVYWNNNWWPILLLTIGSFLLFILANFFNAIRDLESGFFAARPGRKYASLFLQSPLALSLRLQRTGIIAWGIGMFVLGASYGSVLGDLEAFISDNELYSQLLVQAEGVSITEQFLPMLIIVMTLIGVIPPIMAINKLRAEEKKGRLEHLLSRAVSRTELIGGYLLISVVNGFVMVLLGALGLWSAGNAVMDEGIRFGTIFSAMMAYYPAILVMIGVAVVLIGFVPRWTNIIWLYVFYSFIVIYFGGLFQFPDWVGKLSPFGHVAQAPVEEVTLRPLFFLSIIAVALIASGMIGYKKRDLES